MRITRDFHAVWPTTAVSAQEAWCRPNPGYASPSSPPPPRRSHSPSGIAQGEPGGQAPKIHDFQAEEGAKPDLDNRRGSVAPPASFARSAGAATVRWNSLGTPAVVTGAAPLAEGLGADPEQAARAYLKANENLFGLSGEAVDALEKIAANPVGEGHAVLLRQKFGDLPAGVDGQVVIGVRDGKVFHVTSTLSRSSEAPPAARITEQRPWRSPPRTAASTWPRPGPSRSPPWRCPHPTGRTGPSRSS